MQRFCFPKSSRILTARQFKLFEKEKDERRGQFIRLSVRKGRFDCQLGITVSRKFGKAHVRNRFKRIVREAFRLTQHALPASLMLNVRPLDAAKQASMQDIQKELLELTCALQTTCSSSP